MLSIALWMLLLAVLPACAGGYVLALIARRGGAPGALVAAGVPILATILVVVAYWPIPTGDTAAAASKLRLLVVAGTVAPVAAAAVAATFSRWRPGLAAAIAWAVAWGLVLWRSDAWEFLVTGIYIALGVIAWTLVLLRAARVRRRRVGQV